MEYFPRNSLYLENIKVFHTFVSNMPRMKLVFLVRLLSQHETLKRFGKINKQKARNVGYINRVCELRIKHLHTIEQLKWKT